ncbi:MAG: hypothetical protein ABIM20_07880, partial [candidate division WOR-3 bacterium]
GTPASRLSPLNSEVVRKRKQKLLDLAKEKKKQFLLNQIGKVMGGVVETRELDYYSATGDNYVKIHLPLKYNLKSGQVVKIKVDSSYDNFVTGLLAEAI